MSKSFKFWPILAVLGALLLVVLLLQSGGEGPAGPAAELPYSDFKARVERGQVETATIAGERIRGELREPLPAEPGRPASRTYRTRVPGFGDPELLPLLEKQGVEVRVVEAPGEGWGSLLIWLLPWLLIIGIWLFMVRRMRQGPFGGISGGRDIRTFLEGTSRAEEKQGKRVTFADVAGQDNAKREVSELVDYLRDPARYQRLGAEVPHGVLLVGPPGTGKTLLARALAGEAGVPFFHISASEFIEVFVGVGASRVRRMFDEAKKRAPSIIFIDELDSVGRVRGAGLGGGHDEREQTLNQILAEMDGFAGHEAVIVLAATNRPDVLDPALLRPGRFDRHVTLELPDRDARRQILEVHAQGVPLDEDVDLGDVAAATVGFSGADLKNLVNEAAMAAAREGAGRVSQRHVDETRDRIILGTVRTLAIHEEERHRLAVHEAGHTAVAYYLPNTDPIYKVTIVPRGRTLGGTHQLPERERHTLPEDYLRDRLAVTLAGRAAEKVLLGGVSSGADDDIRSATQLARAMVGRWGMSEEVGPVDVRESEEHPFLGREMARPRRFSEATAQAADKAVRRLLTEAEERATKALLDHRPQLDRLVAELEQKEMLDREAVKACLGPPAVATRAAAGRPA